MAKAPSYRKERLSKELVREASQLFLHEFKDPRMGFITVTRAKVTDDYRHATIFVSVLGKETDKRLTMKALKHARGFIQRELSHRVPMRIFPELTFELDDTVEKTFKMLKTLDDLSKEREKKEGVGTEGTGGEEE